MPSPLSVSLDRGAVVAQRFTIQRLAGRGGMGIVFLARDEHTGKSVALKLLQSASSSSEVARRFAREAQLLASLHHPGIVSYVAHGLTETEQPFLAMEWLEGEDLAQRLHHKPLSLSETLQLMHRAADALAAAHAQGIVHRDLKPSNLFLRSGQPQDVVLLDFGVARIHSTSQLLTGSDSVLGTPGYMAPEQASHLQDISPAADIFSLGCVLYECLTGLCPFRAPHVAAVLAKILFSAPTPLSTLRPELPSSIQLLVERMLSKQPVHRPANAGHLLRALAGLELPSELPPPSYRPRRSASAPERGATLSILAGPAHAEQHLASVLLATPRASLKEAPMLSPEEEEKVREQRELLLQNLQAYCAHAVLLADGSLLATFVLERGSATDQAALAAHCALSVKERWQESVVALTTGLSMRGLALPVGDAVDRAAELLQLQKQQNLATSAQVLVDDTTVGLLGPRFRVDKASSSVFLLGGEHVTMDESRPLMGQPTSCVGREQELALLELALTSSIEDSCARAVLVIAPAGTGKSRLRHELMRRLDRQTWPPLVLLGRGDPMSTHTAHGLVGQAVRRLCGVVNGEPLEARRARLSQHLTQHLLPDQQKDATEFLGELCAIPFPAEDSPRLRAAREDPHLMNRQVTRALVTWLKAECSRRPVLLMLEDLHWSDGPSITLMDDVLQELAEYPLMVLALARPEVKDVFPGLWARHVQEVPLRGLSQKASARLVREVLGPYVSEELEGRLVAQAAGNALFLEELIRSVAEGHGDETPGSVLAMLQSRLQRLEPNARRVLLAASILGRTFWAGGVRALLDPPLPLEELTYCLRRLVEQEMVQLQQSSRFADEPEYRFHHALVRDAAYSLVPDGLRAAGHQQAGDWLQAAGESEPLVLAEHYHLGGNREKAIHFYILACRQICERQRMELQGAQRCVKAARKCEPTEPALTELQVLEANIAFWMGDFERASAVAREVLPKLEAGSTSWIQVVGSLLFISARSGRHPEAIMLGQRCLELEPTPKALSHYIEALSFLGAIYCWTGQAHEMRAVRERMTQVGAASRDGLVRGWTCVTQGYIAYNFDARLWQARHIAEEGMKAFSEVGSDRNEMVPRTLLGEVLAALGDVPAAVEVMKAGLAGRGDAGQSGNFLRTYLPLVLSKSGEPEHLEEARRMALLTREEEPQKPEHLSLAPLVLARVALALGHPSEAETWARQAYESLCPLLTYQIPTRTCLSAALLAQGRILEAREEAERSVHLLQQMERLGGIGVNSVSVWLALVEACRAQGDDTAARSALLQAFRCVQLFAEDLPPGAVRERFASQVPENARVLQLACQYSL